MLDLEKDPINPDYYTNGIEVTKFIMSWGLNFNEGNVVKYVCRWRNKNGLEDLHKAKKYLELQIEHETMRLEGEWLNGS